MLSYALPPPALTAQLKSTADTNNQVIAAGPQVLSGITSFNGDAAARYLKVYDQATVPDLTKDVPVAVFTSASMASNAWHFGPAGMRFLKGVAIAITGGPADTDATAVAANVIKITLTLVKP